LRVATPPLEVCVDINHASIDELLKVPGMTRSWVGRIVRFRPYRAKNDLLDRGVLPSEVYDRIKNSIITHRIAQ
jgi:competence protein ComEA